MGTSSRRAAKTRRKATSKASTHRFGGRATAGGVGYEVRVAALVATKMLAGDRCKAWNGISGEDIDAVTMQAREHVDDIVVSVYGIPGAAVFISAKDRQGTIPLTAKSPAFADTVESFVHQFTEMSPLNRAKSRLVWAISSSSGTLATRHLPVALDSYREDDSGALSSFLGRRLAPEKKAIEALIRLVKQVWKKQGAGTPSPSELDNFLRMVYVEVYDFEFGHRHDREAENELRHHVVSDPARAADLWQFIERYFSRANERGTRTTQSALRRALTASGFRLKTRSNFHGDVAVLEALTERNLSQLRTHTVLRFGTRPEDEIHIARTEELSALITAAKAGHLLLTGEPGCGKSGLIHLLCEKLRQEGIPVVLMLAEETSAREQKSLASIPVLTHPLDEVLSNWRCGNSGLLITDALDAVRDPDTQRALRILLQGVKHGRSDWIIVASVREFDLKHSRELREMFPGEGVHGYCSREFSGVAHFRLGSLADAQLDELAAIRPEIRPFVESASKNIRSGGLHRSPFFLRLASELLCSGVPPLRLADWSNPAVLLRRFWDIRVMDGPGANERSVALQMICRQMTALRTVVLSLRELSLSAAGRDALDELRSRGIVQAPALKYDSRISDEDIRFSHHLLHDYAIAVSTIPTVRFADFAAREPNLPVLYRQSFLFALEELWDRDDTRNAFWQSALALEETPQLHSITRILSPLLAARRTETGADLKPLVTALESRARSATAIRVIRRLTSCLEDVELTLVPSGTNAWCVLCEHLARRLPNAVELEVSLVQLLSRLHSLIALATDHQQIQLNDSARVLLAHHVAKPVNRGWPRAARVAVAVICNTFDRAPNESETALSSLLAPSRLAHFPHDDLLSLADEIKSLISGGRSVILRIFEAAFGSEPAPGIWEDFGSVVMPMRMQRSDMWSSVTYSLAEYYAASSGADASLMTELACVVWNTVAAKHRTLYQPERVSVELQGQACEFSLDHAGWSHSESNTGRIFSKFASLLESWAAADEQDRLNAALCCLAERSHTSLMWLTFMKVGARHPLTLGVRLENILGISLMLARTDYRSSAAALLAALHRTGDLPCRERLERRILEFKEGLHLNVDDASVPLWTKQVQEDLLCLLDEQNIVHCNLRTWRQLLGQGGLGPDSDAQLLCSLSEDGVDHLGTFTNTETHDYSARLLENLKLFAQGRVDDGDWGLLAHCGRALGGSQLSAAERGNLHGHLVWACQCIAEHATWPLRSQRWKFVRRVLLDAAGNSESVAPAEADGLRDERVPGYSLPDIGVHAVFGLLSLARRFGRVDNALESALRRLSRDESLSVRCVLARKIVVLWRPSPCLMWEIVDSIIAEERSLGVLNCLLHSLAHLHATAPDAVNQRLREISCRVEGVAPASPVHESLALLHLFHFFRTGDPDFGFYMTRIISRCEDVHASRTLTSLLATCRMQRRLTMAENPGSSAEMARERAWLFYLQVLEAAQGKLLGYRGQWRQLRQCVQPDKAAIEAVEGYISETARLVNEIATQIYFASGAFEEKHGDRNESLQLSDTQLHQFWRDARPILRALVGELHPGTAHRVLEALQHLLHCSPSEIFLLASRAILTSSAAGFHHDSLAVGQAVQLIQQALADHPEIFRKQGDQESEALEALLKILDLFVDAGWDRARELTYHLEEIYR